MTTTAPLSRTPRRRRRSTAASILRPAVPYLVCIGGFLLAWQLLSLLIGVGRLPGPINVIVDTWDPYISQPFFDDGGTSKGLGWQILISLTRVAAGYGLAAVVGISVGGLLGLNRFVGKGLDPVIQVLRTVPPLSDLADGVPGCQHLSHFRDLYHGDLAHHHQYSRGHP